MPAHQRTNGVANKASSEVEINASLSPRTPPAELWEAWRLAQAFSELALNTWYAASHGEKARTHAAYTDALAREGHAAEALAAAALDGAVAAA